jgi:hypothetical protein
MSSFISDDGLVSKNIFEFLSTCAFIYDWNVYLEFFFFLFHKGACKHCPWGIGSLGLYFIDKTCSDLSVIVDCRSPVMKSCAGGAESAKGGVKLRKRFAHTAGSTTGVPTRGSPTRRRVLSQRRSSRTGPPHYANTRQLSASLQGAASLRLNWSLCDNTILNVQ